MTLKEEVLQRKEELESELLEEGDLDDLTINEQLRDEFSDPKYKDTLIELGINEDLSDELKPVEEDLTINEQIGGDRDKILKLLLVTEEDIQETEMILRGYKKERKKWYLSREGLLPSEDIAEVILFLRTNFLPQNLMTKLSGSNNSLSDYLRLLNISLNYFNDKFTDYPDEIVNLKDQQFIIKMLLNKCQVIINAIRNGEYAEIVKQITTNTYNESSNPEKSTKDKIKDVLNS